MAVADDMTQDSTSTSSVLGGGGDSDAKKPGLGSPEQVSEEDFLHDTTVDETGIHRWLVVAGPNLGAPTE